MKSVVFNLFLWVTKDHMQIFNPKQLKVGAMFVASLRVTLFTICHSHGSFYFGRNGMHHSIPTGMECHSLARLKKYAAWPECSLLSAVLDVKLAHCTLYLARVCAVAMTVLLNTDLSAGV